MKNNLIKILLSLVLLMFTFSCKLDSVSNKFINDILQEDDTKEEYEILHKAFFRKRNQLEKIKHRGILWKINMKNLSNDVMNLQLVQAKKDMILSAQF